MAMRLKYKQPECDCGRKLRLSAEIDGMYEVNTKGKPVFRRAYMYSYVLEYLYCLSCDAHYDVSKDQKGRLVRGRRWTE